MEGGEGMVAVVRGLRDSGLAVTLLDGSRQYTLMPNAGKTSPVPQVHITQNAPPGHLPSHMHIPSLTGPHGSAPQPQMRSASEVSGDQPVRCDSGSQATDGRYASMYKMAHCSVTPTSPPVQLTEFPPQRAELCPGHGNFEVGGSGSGEHYVPCRANGCYRGGMSWPDRGSVCSPRPSREPDAFANSLRKYPNLSVERSTEMVERLITYTQAKNMSKNYQNRYPSPSRHGIESNTSNQLVLDRSSSRNTVPRSCQRGYEPEVRIRPRVEESPTRDLRPHECDCTDYRRMAKTDSRCLNVRKVKDLRSCSYTVPYNQQSPRSSDRYDHNMTGQKTPSLLTATNSVNMEVQAAAEMVSREVATVPGMEPVKRTVAVPLSRTSSDEQRREASSLVTNNFTVQLCGNIQAFRQDVPECSQGHAKNIKSVQTSFSSVDLTTEKCGFCKRKIKSQEDIRNEDWDFQLQNEVLEWLRETYSMKPTSKSWGEKMQKLAQKLKKPGGEERIRQKIQKYLDRMPSQFSECDEDGREFREHLPDNIIKNLKKMFLKPEKKKHYTSPVRIYRIEVPKYKTEYDKNIDILKWTVDNWLKEIPVKKRDFLGRSIRKEDVLESVVKKIEPYILNRHNFDKNYRQTLKCIILDIMNEIPIDIDECDKTSYLNRLAISLVCNLLSLDDYGNCSNMDNEQRHNTNNMQNVNDINVFVYNEIASIMRKMHLSISTKRLALLEEELKDAFMKIDLSKMEDINSTVKEDIFIILHNLGGLSYYQANYFTDIILKHFKEELSGKILKRPNQEGLCESSVLKGVPCSGTYSVFHSRSKLKSNITNAKPSKSHVNDNKKGNSKSYKQKLMEQIEEWLDNLNGQISLKKGVRDRAMNDLAEDVIDRLQYLEMNPMSRGTEENELSYLKYQIFKWINKVAGENITDTIEHADELMNRIHKVNVQIETKPQQNHIKPTITKTKSLTITDNNKSSSIIKSLKDVIDDWVRELSSDLKEKCNVDDIANELVSKIQKIDNSLTDNDEVINREVDKWVRKLFRGKNKSAVDKLKETLKCISRSKNLNVNSKQEKACTRKYEDIIDNWMDTVFFEMFGETLDYKNRNEHIHDFAMKSYATLNSSVASKGKINLESIVLEWLAKLPLSLCTDKEDFQKECVSTLVESLCSVDLAQIEEHNITRDENKLLNNTSSSTRSNAKALALEVQNQNNIGQIQMSSSNVTVYGVQLPSTSKGEDTVNITKTSTKEITEDDIEGNVELYLKQLVEQIDEWLSALQIPQIHDRGFREIVVNDLAGDIIDRHKYLELNPSSRKEENELEQLKYQIFKWINKLVGEDQQETVDKASDLMHRIQSIPVPKLVKLSEQSHQSPKSEVNKHGSNKKDISKSSQNISKAKPRDSRSEKVPFTSYLNNNTANSRKGDVSNVKSKIATTPTSVRLSSPLGFTTGPMANANQKVNQMHSASSKRPGEITKQTVDERQNSKYSASASKLRLDAEDSGDLPSGLTLEEVYQYYDNIFKEHIQEIPLQTPTPDQQMFADLARKGIYNGIWKTFFQLKADPDIENDYSYFELLFEDHIDSILDCLPQTEEVQKIRPGWKSKLLFNVMSMLRNVHNITDTPSFRQKIAEKFDRQFIKAQYQESSNLHQHGFVVQTADAYILYSKYKEEDPIRANIYRQRLMNRIEELAETVKRENNVDFRYINQAQLCQIAMQLLESVPIPHDDVLKEEADEILVGEEIEEWYRALPVMPLRNETDEVLRKRMRELLAKKLCQLEKGVGIDDSAVDVDMKHEVSKFLHEKAELQPNEDLNIDFMVEELTNRLRTRKHNMLGYETFEKETPLSSTFVQTDPGEALAPLVDIGVYNGHTSQGVGPNDQDYPGTQCPRQHVMETDHRADPTFDSRPANQGIDRKPISGGLADVSLVRSSGLCQPSCKASPGVINRSLLPNGSTAKSYPEYQVGQADDRGRVTSGQRSNLGQGYGQANLSMGQPMPSTYISRDPSPTGATRSTARVASPMDPGVIDEEFNEEEGEVRYKCRCMERVWKCKRRHYCEDDRPPHCYPMPFPCRYFY